MHSDRRTNNVGSKVVLVNNKSSALSRRFSTATAKQALGPRIILLCLNSTRRSLTNWQHDLIVHCGKIMHKLRCVGRLMGLAFRSIVVFAILLGAGLANPANAQSCKSSGNLVYLGNTRGDASSVWLSGTNAGAFSLSPHRATRPSIPGRRTSAAGFISRHRPWSRRAMAAHACSTLISRSPVSSIHRTRSVIGRSLRISSFLAGGPAAAFRRSGGFFRNSSHRA